MSLAPCSRCGQPVGEQEPSCSACGQPRAAPAPPASPPAPPARASKAVTRLVAALGCALAAFVLIGRHRAREEAPAPAPAPAAAAVPASTAPAPTAEPNYQPQTPAEFQARLASAAASAANPTDAEAELAPAPTDLKRTDYLIYGVVYDLATKMPVRNAAVALSGSASGKAFTDSHGWYRLAPEQSIFSGNVSVSVFAAGYQNGGLMERDPSLASFTDVERRTVAEEADLPLKPATFRFGAEEPLVELNLAMIPVEWPAGMPAAMDNDAQNPPVPDEPDEKTCRYYGVVYDLATLKPLRRLALDVGATGRIVSRATNGKGQYVFDVPIRFFDQNPVVTVAAPGYRPGVLPERDPPMRVMSAKLRREVADVSDLAFDPSPLPTDCDDGLVRFDLAAVPLAWPKR